MKIERGTSDSQRSETLRNAVIETDLNGTITAWSPGAERLFGWPAAEALGQDGIQFLVSPGGRKSARAALAKLNAGKDISAEYQLLRSGGEHWRGTVSAAAVCDESGKPKRVIAIIEEVNAGWPTETRIRKLEEEVRRLKQHQRMVADASRTYTFERNLLSGEVRFSEAVTAVTGLHPRRRTSREEFYRHVHPDDVDSVQDAVESSLQLKGPGTYNVEFRFIRPDGATRWIAARGKTRFEGKGAARKAVRQVGLAIDITDLKTAQLELAGKEQRLRFAVQAANGFTYERDLRTGAIDFDESFSSLLDFPDGYQPPYDEFYSRVDPADAAAIKEKVRLATSLSEPTTLELDYRFHLTDGQVRWFRSKAGTVFDDDSGKPTRIVGLVTDITDRKRAETAERFLSEASRVMASSLDLSEILDRVVNVAVPAQADMCGVYLVQPDGSLDLAALAHRSPNSLELLREATRHFQLPQTHILRQVAATGEPELIPDLTEGSIESLVRDQLQLQLVSELRPLSVITVPLIARGDILGVVTLLTEKGGRVYDTYDLATAEEFGRRCGMAVDNARLYGKLADSEERLALTLQVSGVGFIEYRRDLAGGYHANERWAEIFGWTLDELPCGDQIETWYRSQVHPDDLGTLLQKAREFQPGVTQTYSFEIRIRHKQAGWAWVRVINYVRERDAAGLVTDGIHAILDVTDLKEAERTLQAYNEELEQSVRMRTSELEELTNRLRLLALELTAAEQNERRRLAELLHDDLQQLLIAARLQASMTPVDETRAAAAATRDLTVSLLDQAITGARTLTAQLRPPALYESGLAASLEWLAEWMQKAHGLNIDLDIDTGLRPIVDIEAALLFESVRELLLNVVKHAEVESARVSLRRGAKGWLQLSVSDPGKGFDPRSIDKPRKGPGGLGLFSLRERLSILGGTFKVRSAPGLGTTIDLLWPIAGAEELENESAPPQPLPTGTMTGAEPTRNTGQTTVLVVDDHAVVRQSIASVVNAQPDMTVVAEASDGRQAVDSVAEHGPQVVIVDVNLPVLNGVQACREIRSQFPDVHMIGLSVHDDAATRQAMLDAGAQDYLSKDSPVEALLEAIRRLAPVPNLAWE